MREPVEVQRHRWAWSKPSLRAFASAMSLLAVPGLVAVVLSAPTLSVGALAVAMQPDVHFTVQQIGLVAGGYHLASALFASMASRPLRRVSPVLVVKTGLLASVVISLAVASTRSAMVLAIGCLLSGVANGLSTPALNLLIVRGTPAGRQGIAFGIKVAAAPAGTALAAMMAVGMAALGWSWTMFFWGVALVGALTWLAFGSVYRGRVGPPDRASRPVSGMASSWSIWLLALAGLLASCATTVLAFFLLVTLVDQGVPSAAAASLLAVGGWLVIAGRLGVGALSDRLPEPRSHLQLILGMLLIFASGALVFATGAPFALMAVASCAAMGLGWAWPGLLHRAVIEANLPLAARATSVTQTGTYLGAVIGPLGFGFIAERYSFDAAWFAAAGVSTLAAGMVWCASRVLAGADKKLTTVSASPVGTELSAP